MSKAFKAAIFCVMIAFFFEDQLSADLVVMKNGDRLFGKIQNQNFALYSPYGQIVIRNDFLKKLTIDETDHALSSIQSINNDFFSGLVLIDEFKLLLDNGNQKSIPKNHIRTIMMDTRGLSYQITTAVFTMKNNDKFSGRFLTSNLKVKTGYMAALLRSDNLQRIEMTFENPGKVKIQLINGDMISGELLEEQLRVAPDVVSQLTLNTSAISSIQFKADKMVLKELSSLSQSQMDGDGDGIPDHLDMCPDSPWGYPVDQYGCSKDPDLAQGRNPFDRDNDGILDDVDQCPGTPEGVPVDPRGCPALRAILFDFDKYELRNEYYPLLDKVVSMLIKNPAMNLEIQGHTDNIGNAQYNLDLSNSRAQAVKDYLVKKGIDAKRVTIMGYGDTKNKTTNSTTTGRAMNRRAEIVPVNE